jgi:predicted DNA-binding transcriptional regulator AlpA
MRTDQEKISLCIEFLAKHGYTVASPYMTQTEIGAFLGVSNSTVSNWLNLNTKQYKPDFPRPMNGSTGKLRFKSSEVKEWAEKHCEVA